MYAPQQQHDSSSYKMDPYNPQQQQRSQQNNTCNNSQQQQNNAYHRQDPNTQYRNKIDNYSTQSPSGVTGGTVPHHNKIQYSSEPSHNNGML